MRTRCAVEMEGDKQKHWGHLVLGGLMGALFGIFGFCGLCCIDSVGQRKFYAIGTTLGFLIALGVYVGIAKQKRLF